jgi:hypothetical protein
MRNPRISVIGSHVLDTHLRATGFHHNREKPSTPKPGELPARINPVMGENGYARKSR